MFLKLLCIVPLLVTLVNSHGYELKQVIVLSRHNIRTPVSNILELYGSKKWNTFDEPPGYLTSRGRRLEVSMGKYFSDWLSEEGLLDDNLLEEQVYVYANVVPRTVETAKAFVEGAFGDAVEVNYNNSTSFDPIFLPIIRNDSETFIETVQNNMQTKINNIDLKNAYVKLNSVVNFTNETFCETQKMCNLSEEGTNVTIQVYNVPKISGALNNSYVIIDELLMEYYDGKLDDEWGLQTVEQWGEIPRIHYTYNDVSFKTSPADVDEASTLIEYIADIFNGTKKFYLIVGHDGNIHTLTSALGFKDYSLDGQLEKAPIGGKVVFEKWHDGACARDLLRVRYVYQSAAQLRDGTNASSLNPPFSAPLEIENCPVDRHGFCSWDVFISILNNLLP